VIANKGQQPRFDGAVGGLELGVGEMAENELASLEIEEAHLRLTAHYQEMVVRRLLEVFNDAADLHEVGGPFGGGHLLDHRQKAFEEQRVGRAERQRHRRHVLKGREQTPKRERHENATLLLAGRVRFILDDDKIEAPCVRVGRQHAVKRWRLGPHLFKQQIDRRRGIPLPREDRSPLRERYPSDRLRGAGFGHTHRQETLNWYGCVTHGNRG